MLVEFSETSFIFQRKEGKDRGRERERENQTMTMTTRSFVKRKLFNFSFSYVVDVSCLLLSFPKIIFKYRQSFHLVLRRVLAVFHCVRTTTKTMMMMIMIGLIHLTVDLNCNKIINVGTGVVHFPF